MKRGASRIGTREAGRAEGTRMEKVRSAAQRLAAHRREGAAQRRDVDLVRPVRCAPVVAEVDRSLLARRGRAGERGARRPRQGVAGHRSSRASSRTVAQCRAGTSTALRCAFDNVIAQREAITNFPEERSPRFRGGISVLPTEDLFPMRGFFLRAIRATCDGS
jgi:hypothetical protein